MANIDELKKKLAAEEKLVNSLRPAADAASIRLQESQSALDAFSNQPNKVTYKTLDDARKASAANPNDAQLKQRVNEIQEQWDARQSQFRPLLDARDEASKAAIEARRPLVRADEDAERTEIEIARLDPSQPAVADATVEQHRRLRQSSLKDRAQSELVSKGTTRL
jgi:hypothetical protein